MKQSDGGVRKRRFGQHGSLGYGKKNQAPVQCFTVMFCSFDIRFEASVVNVTHLCHSITSPLYVVFSFLDPHATNHASVVPPAHHQRAQSPEY